MNLVRTVCAELQPLTPVKIEEDTGRDGLDWARLAALPTVDLLGLHVFRPGNLVAPTGRPVAYSQVTTQCQPNYTVRIRFASLTEAIHMSQGTLLLCSAELTILSGKQQWGCIPLLDLRMVPGCMPSIQCSSYILRAMQSCQCIS